MSHAPVNTTARSSSASTPEHDEQLGHQAELSTESSSVGPYLAHSRWFTCQCPAGQRTRFGQPGNAYVH